jgi:hypothetical protein
MSQIRTYQEATPYDEAQDSGGINTGAFFIFALSAIFWPIAYGRMFNHGMRFRMFLGAMPFAIFSFRQGFYLEAGIVITVVAFFVWVYRFTNETSAQ